MVAGHHLAEVVLVSDQLGLFEIPAVSIPPNHPAKFTDALLPVLADAVRGYALVLDPFAGVGRVHELPNRTIGVELEPEWACAHPDTLVGNALRLPFPAATFDAVCTSPTYGNRLADHHQARDGSVRHSYTHDLGRPLHPDNSGAMQWGDRYRAFHLQAWLEVRRVLRPGGRFVLNLKDHVRDRQVIPITGWHLATLLELGFEVVTHHQVACPGLRYGDNRARVEYESVILLDRADEPDTPGTSA